MPGSILDTRGLAIRIALTWSNADFSAEFLHRSHIKFAAAPAFTLALSDLAVKSRQDNMGEAACPGQLGSQQHGPGWACATSRRVILVALDRQVRQCQREGRGSSQFDFRPVQEFGAEVSIAPRQGSADREPAHVQKTCAYVTPKRTPQSGKPTTRTAEQLLCCQSTPFAVCILEDARVSDDLQSQRGPAFAGRVGSGRVGSVQTRWAGGRLVLYAAPARSLSAGASTSYITVQDQPRICHR